MNTFLHPCGAAAPVCAEPGPMRQGVATDGPSTSPAAACPVAPTAVPFEQLRQRASQRPQAGLPTVAREPVAVAVRDWSAQPPLERRGLVMVRACGRVTERAVTGACAAPSQAAVAARQPGAVLVETGAGGRMQVWGDGVVVVVRPGPLTPLLMERSRQRGWSILTSGERHA